MKKQSKTNETSSKIIELFTRHDILAWRQNTSGIPLHREGVIIGFRPSAKAGISDIIAILPPVGRGVFIEIKTGKDKIRPEQEGFKRNVSLMGGIFLEVKDFQDFLDQWDSLCTGIKFDQSLIETV